VRGRVPGGGGAGETPREDSPFILPPNREFDNERSVDVKTVVNEVRTRRLRSRERARGGKSAVCYDPSETRIPFVPPPPPPPPPLPRPPLGVPARHCLALFSGAGWKMGEFLSPARTRPPFLPLGGGVPSRGGSRIPRLSRRSSALPIPIFVCITRTGADGAEFRPPGDPGGTRFSSARKALPPAPDGRVRDTAVSFPFICVFFASLVGRRPPWRCGGCSCRPSFPREAAPRPLGGCLSHFVAPASNSSNKKAQ